MSGELWIDGPEELPCEEKCEVPAGVAMAPVPLPRHSWSDVLVCPNGCGRAFLLRRDELGVAS